MGLVEYLLLFHEAHDGLDFVKGLLASFDLTNERMMSWIGDVFQMHAIEPSELVGNLPGYLSRQEQLIV